MLTDLVKSFTYSASRHIALKVPLTCVYLLLGVWDRSPHTTVLEIPLPLSDTSKEAREPYKDRQ